MAVDVKTLRIGSHVEYNGKRVCVDEIRTLRLDGSPIRLLVSHNGLIYGDPSIDETEPIPITPDLLKELGFKCTDKGRVQSWWHDFFCLDHLNGKSYYNFGAIHLKYLHELEDLYYLIDGVELIKE